MEPAMSEKLTPDQCLKLWMDVYDAAEAMVLAGLRREIGPDGDLQQAHRLWYQQQMEEHDRVMRETAMNLCKRGVVHGR
jgi:hypothetical protein